MTPPGWYFAIAWAGVSTPYSRWLTAFAWALTVVASRPATSMTKSWPTFCFRVMCRINESTWPRYGASPELPGPPAVAADAPTVAAMTRDRPITSPSDARVRWVVDADRANTGASEFVCLPPEMKDETTLSLTALVGNGGGRER